MAENIPAQGYDPFMGEIGIKIRDLEERQKIIKDRILLIGQNLIDIKEKTSNEIIEMKQDLQILKQEIKRIKDFIENISDESSNFARKSELEILQKQAKMFQPMNLVTKDELKKLVDEQMQKHKH